MTDTKNLKNLVAKGGLDDIFTSIYGNATPDMRERYTGLIAYHEENFGESGIDLFSASGRTELGGNHTDHNLGKVLAASIQLDTIAAVTPTDDGKVTLYSMGYPGVEIDLSSLEPVKEEENRTEALVRGIARGFADRGCKPGGFRASTTSSVLKGSGLSSSAALEVLVGAIFNTLYNSDRLATTEIAQIGQFAENNFFGKPCGLMDQVACANGGIVEIDFADPSAPVITPVKYNFLGQGYRLMVVDTGGNHADLTPDYAAVPAEMKAVAALFGRQTLRGLTVDDLIGKALTIREKEGDRAFLRAIHFLNENDRVEAMIEKLKAGNTQAYLELVSASGRSSFQYLQNVYSTSAEDEQGISLALALTEQFLAGRGACRVHGGGFAGTIQVYVPAERSAEYTGYMERVFGEGSVTPLTIRQKPVGRIY